MLIAIATLTGLGVPAATAAAKDLVFWGNEGATPGKISYANLDGSGGGDLNTVGAPVDGPNGLALDVAAGRIYWADYNPATSEISFANLDGSGGGGTLNTTGAKNDAEPSGVAIDPPLGRLYWTEGDGTAISYANLGGSGGGDLATTGATSSNTSGIAVDAADGRIYWGEFAANKIAYANLDGSGGGHDLNTSGAVVNDPEAVAIDPNSGRVYWTNRGGNSISYANLNGGGGGTLTIVGATVNQPVGIAIDPVAGKIFWTNYTSTGGGVFYANLDGSNGGQLTTTGATMNSPGYPVLLRAPVAAGNPQIRRGSTTGSSLTCSQGAWAPDLLGSFLYRVPHTFAYQWARNGADIGGATSSSYTATAAGSYRCRVTASNEAGSVSQTSASFDVSSMTKLTITGVSQSHRRWRRGKALPHIASAKGPPVGTTFRFRLNESARVRFVFRQQLPGRRVGGHCVAPTAKNRNKHKCTRLMARGTLSFSFGAGAHTLRFQGRLRKHKNLPIGRYALLIAATNSASQHASEKLAFTIVTG